MAGIKKKKPSKGGKSSKKTTAKKLASKKAISKKVVAAAEFMLPATLNIVNAEKFLKEIKDCLSDESGGGVVLDGSEVEVLTSSCVQIIVSASKTLDGGGKNFSIKSPSAVMVDVMADMGLESEMKKWSVGNA